MTSFVDEYANFVLKLKIEAQDGKTQIRRIKLPRIADKEGGVSYDELLGLVVTFVFPDATSPDNYHVTLTYKDVDQDDVVISSSDELVDAIEQFSDQRILRITTEVRPKFGNHVPVSRTANVKAAAASPAPAPTGVPDPQASASAGVEPGVQDVLESFVGVLANAVVNLEKGLSKPAKTATKDVTNHVKAVSKGVQSTAADAAKAAKIASKDAAKAAKIASKDAAKAAKIASRDARRTARVASKDVARTARGISKAVSSAAGDVISVVKVSSSAPASTRQARSGTFVSSPAAETKVNAPEDPKDVTEEPEAKEPQKFIHGRHTCDSCLTTPIIGKRYHSTNIDDYDLCERCYANYHGDEIKFESVELERDAKFQARWWHRHQCRQMRLRRHMIKSNHCRKNQAKCDSANGKATPVEQKQPPRVQTPAASPEPVVQAPAPVPTPSAPTMPTTAPPRAPSQPQSFHSWEAMRSLAHQHLAPHLAPHIFGGQHGVPEESMEFDQALKEAIRRSLQDSSQRSVEAEADATEPETTVADIETGVVKEEPSKDPAPSVAEEDIVVEPQSQKAAVEDSAPTVPTEEEVAAGTNVGTKPVASPVAETKAETNVEVAMPVEDSSSAESDGSKSKETEEINTDDSFASDAIGSGDVAEAMGATLDMVAGVINDMLNEDKNGNCGSAGSKKDTEIYLGSDNSSASDEDLTLDVGATIVDGADTEDEDAVATGSTGTVENEWEVISQDNNNTDESMARAAEMLGSALLESSMQSQDKEIEGDEKQVETVTNDDDESNKSASSSASSVSVGSSIPSTLPSISGLTAISNVSQAQHARWHLQLASLRELGFEDEAKCVDVLERLQAANIGVGSTDEVTVTQVINEMLKYA